ncbi:MAG: hypothetical protein Q8S03_10270 [Brevundimonas sp.]|nr:hypothetical protein [Brevundimonas sp.]
MTQPHAKRRGVTPRPSDAHIRLLRRLLKRAEGAAKDPVKNAKPFAIAADKAAKAILPVGHQHPGNDFSWLIRLGKRFLLLTFVQRMDETTNILARIRACEAVLDEAEAPGQRRLPYADN